MAITLGTAVWSAQAVPTWTGSVFRTTLSVTISSGQTVLSVLVSGGGFNFTTIAFDGVDLTRRDSNSEGYLYVYDMVNPPVGTYNLTLDASAGTQWGILALPLSGVDTTSPVRGVTLNSESYVSSKATNFTTVAGDLVVDAVNVAANRLPASNATEIFTSTGSNGSSTVGYGFSYKEAVGDPTSIGWTIGGPEWMGQIGVVYKPATEAPSTAAGSLWSGLLR